MSRNGNGLLEGYREEYLTCRDLLHAWKTIRWRVSGSMRERTLLCLRCTTERREQVNARGGIVDGTRRYKYPPDYRLTDVVRLDAAREARKRLARLAARGILTLPWMNEAPRMKGVGRRVSA